MPKLEKLLEIGKVAQKLPIILGATLAAVQRLSAYNSSTIDNHLLSFEYPVNRRFLSFGQSVFGHSLIRGETLLSKISLVVFILLL